MSPSGLYITDLFGDQERTALRGQLNISPVNALPPWSIPIMYQLKGKLGGRLIRD